ncbi:MAG: hypothetical protein QF805_23740, partial [Pirellulaceae bacterium]|nr:hypothetical protein [Pirellulaceae bacterium]
GVAARAAVRPDSPAAGSEQSSFLLWSVGFENRNLQSSRHYTPVDGIIVVIAGILAMGIILAGPILAQVIIIFWA